MRTFDHDQSRLGAVIPFAPRQADTNDVHASTIAVLVAVTILHHSDERPEDKLVELIEHSGDAEIIDAMDATDGLSDTAVICLPGPALNDNMRLS